MEKPTTLLCRLCSGQAKLKFSLTLLQKYPVGYYECLTCESLQTEEPFWLQEAYQHSLSILDTGAAARVLFYAARISFYAQFFSLKNILDFGGGDGLLCRLLRDKEWNCYVKDKYAHPIYAQTFTEPNFEKPDLLLAFEVLEHMPQPKQELGALFQRNPDFFIFSTETYSKGQGESWHYLAPETGQHVFFYSLKALKQLAKEKGYNFEAAGGYFIFSKRKISFFQKFCLWLAFKFLWDKRTYFVKKEFPSGPWKDQDAIRASLKKDQKSTAEKLR